jgi:hypothetical protein
MTDRPEPKECDGVVLCPVAINTCFSAVKAVEYNP